MMRWGAGGGESTARHDRRNEVTKEDRGWGKSQKAQGAKKQPEIWVRDQ